MTPANFQQWIQHPETLSKDTLYELRTQVARYPYFQSLRLLYLKNLYLLHDITFGAELRKATLYVADRRALFALIEGEKYKLHHRKHPIFSKEELDDEPTFDRTLTLIDAFLSTIPEEFSEQTDFDYSTDYTTYLVDENDEEIAANPISDTPKLRGHELIDGFIEQSGSDSTPYRLNSFDGQSSQEANISGESHIEEDEAHSEEDEDDSCFTETLAKIYVKQQRYSKALEIIKKLSLKYPKKNAYFADQIRFLEKLIINAKSK